ncbi:hypothetical protein AB833_21965 [Chromatiales bacterium (ex Bugula neritina AB1)]|nr:hypothetical protein AB833_21965 [Chromatiales bacterium (ex Bugula neritina AB1)]
MTDQLMSTLVEFTVKMEVSAESGDWDQVKVLDNKRQLVLDHAIENNIVEADIESMNRIEAMQSRILDLAKTERQNVTRAYEEGLERLHNCQSYLDTDRQSALKE